jgi:hypothetical protein
MLCRLANGLVSGMCVTKPAQLSMRAAASAVAGLGDNVVRQRMHLLQTIVRADMLHHTVVGFK